MSGGPQFAPNTNSAQGSPISAALLNGLVQAQGYVQSGGVPPTSASLVVTMPATQAVVPIAGGLSVWVSMASGALPALTASHDSYIDLVSTTTYPYTGSYVVAGVANGASAPAVAANGLRLCKVVTSGSASTAVVDLAPHAAVGGHAAEQTTYLAAHGVALSAVGVYTTVSGESYSYTTLQPSSRVQVSVSIPIGMNTISGDVKFILTMTAVPAGSAVPLAGIEPQWGTIKLGITHGVATVTTVFNADKAGAYTLDIQYVTTAGATGTLLYNEPCNFGGVTTYQGTIQFVELGG